jgi:hypothetical protein
MAAQQTTPSIPLSPDEKSAQVMIYTPANVYWGSVVVKQMIRVSTWLRTNTVPDRIHLLHAKALVTSGGAASRAPLSFAELHVPLGQILAFHLIPPAQDPLDFDATEPNRKMEPVNALVGSFYIKGSIRISSSGTLKKFLEVNRESFTALYDAEISNLATPAMGALAVPFVLVRQDTTVFTTR